jgi:hypothetical protein
MKLLTVLILGAALAFGAGQSGSKKKTGTVPAKQPAAQPAAQKAPAQKAPTPKAPTPARQIQAVEIPAGAVEYEPGAFRHTDAQGKKWIYRKTPFGVARMEDRPSEPPPDTSAAFTKATEAGDTVRFERPGPFGTYRWERKKTELTASEKAIWERQSSTVAKQD